jgi:transcriptional regulator with XRE-family HTH domain
MKERIIRFLTNENKSSAQFAEEIGVQPSGVSHILSGRNNPSLDFVMKMLRRYPALSTDWLIFGREPMYKGVHAPTLFDELFSEGISGKQDNDSMESADKNLKSAPSVEDSGQIQGDGDNLQSDISGNGRVQKVLFFYSDRTFREYLPG